MARRVGINSMRKWFTVTIIAVLLFASLASFVFAQEVTTDLSEREIVGTSENTVCCEETKSGLFCQDVPEDDCKADSRQPPTACESTSFCNPGYCYDSTEGTCLDNVPQEVCNSEGGTWSKEKPAACELGCCVLGDQASFVTLVRCKRLSAFYGLETNYNSEIQGELQCILTARGEEKGACVYQEDFEVTCKMTKRSECDAEKILGSRARQPEEEAEEELENEGDVQTSPAEGEVEFHPGVLCSSEELNTNCGPSEETTCLDGREEVYFLDTCGNPANIYDASKINDDAYWDEMIDKRESCNPNNANENSQGCGNCNYLLGSFCRNDIDEPVHATYGNHICADLNCYDEEVGEERLHGESWCAFDVEGTDFVYKEQEQDLFTRVVDAALRDVREGIGLSLDFRGAATPVGSKYYRKVCIHGEIITEPCADFRQEECIENVADNGFTEAACRVNRWQDCTAQYTRLECENTDRRDCVWMAGQEYVFQGAIAQAGGSREIEQNSLANFGEELAKIESGERELGGCVPKTPPGLKFWAASEDEEGNDVENEASVICSQANAVCPVTYEQGLSDDEWTCIENCECLEEITELKRAQMCMALGDCGPKVNINNDIGYGLGYKTFTEEIDSD
jgi:hypothetical protein